MSVEVVAYSAPDGDGRHRRWQGVRKYTCPNGCSAGFYDFRHAYLAEGGGADRRARRQQVAWTLTGLLVAFGLVAMYALFMYAIGAVPVAGWVRPVLWVLTTAAFAGVGALLVFPPRGTAPAASSGAPAAASQAPGAGTAPAPAAPATRRPAAEPGPSRAPASSGEPAGVTPTAPAAPAASPSRRASG